MHCCSGRKLSFASESAHTNRSYLGSPSLSVSFKLIGNKNNAAQDSEGKSSEHHVRVFEADAIESHRNVQLTRGGMILFALISGGDYDNGKVGQRYWHNSAVHEFCV